MKLDVGSFSRLWKNVDTMGAARRMIDVGQVWSDEELEFDTRLSTSGIDIDLNEVGKARTRMPSLQHDRKFKPPKA